LIGPCAKATVTCEIIATNGQRFVGTNYCNNAQAVCPRVIGEGYEKCASICDQVGHAEVVAVGLAGDNAKGATAYLSGHTYACQPCQEALFGAGVAFLSVASKDGGKP
jgi:pyrimidine deaminase RibD-like protein